MDVQSRENIPDSDPDYFDFIELTDEELLKEVDNMLLAVFEILNEFDDTELKDFYVKVKKFLEKATVI